MPKKSFMDLPVGHRVFIISVLIVAAGVACGLSLDADERIPQPWNRVSSIIGWIYFFCWSVSFYPQILLNYEHHSVVGLSLDYTVLNMLGFTCYSIFYIAFYFSESVQHQYMRRHEGRRNAVQLNDLVFSLHAEILVAVTLLQCAIYPRGGQVVSKPAIVWTGGTVAAAILFGVAVIVTGNDEDSTFNTLNLLYLLSSVNLFTTLVKRLPQIALNYQRKSTVGWSVWNVLLDIAGGLLSIVQQVLDCAATHDWTAMKSDPSKFFLGLVSIAVDVVFILQHYVFYAKNDGFIPHGGEAQPFLPK